jgi:hypothetical protein
MKFYWTLRCRPLQAVIAASLLDVLEHRRVSCGVSSVPASEAYVYRY